MRRTLPWVVCGVVGLFAFGVAFGVSPGSAHDDHDVCATLPSEQPTFGAHMEHVDIVEGRIELTDVIAHGQALFDTVFNVCDGQGRPATTGGGDKRDPAGQPAFLRTSAPDSSACAGCHNQPRSGGGGDFVANVFVLAQTLDPVTESVNGEFSNERNTLGMFGAGPIELLAREMTDDLHVLRDQAIADAMASGSDVRLELTSKGVTFGHITALPDGTVDTSEVKGVDPDLIVKPFHQAGAVLSIREFTVNAMNHHHGMQAEERFDLNPAKGPDFDEDGISRELTIGDITAGAVFQAQLGTPGRVVPETEAERESAAHGEILFEQVGCTTCHVPMLELDSSMFGEPYGRNPDGTFSDSSTTFWLDLTTDGEEPRLESNGDGGAYVRAYTDLKRHNLCDEEIDFFCNEQLTQGRPDQDGRPGTEFFLTRKLWDVGNSAPYGHRGDLPTITEAILYHGGEARESRDAFVSLSAAEQADIVGFLKTLQVLPPAPSATDDGPPWVWMIVSALVAAVVVGVAVWYVGFRRSRRPSPAS